MTLKAGVLLEVGDSPTDPVSMAEADSVFKNNLVASQCLVSCLSNLTKVKESQTKLEEMNVHV